MVQINLIVTKLAFWFHFTFTWCIEFLILVIRILAATVSPYEIRMLAGVNKGAKHLHPTDTHPLTHLHVTEYLPPSHHHLQPFHFSSLSFPSSPSVHCGGRRSFAFVAVEGKGRSGLHLSFASCYHFSHLYPLPTSAPLTGLPPLVLPLTYSNWSGVQ